MNKVELLGNLGSAPEVRYTQGGIAVCNFRMATNEKYKDRNEELQERTEWHRIVVWGKAAENCGEYLNKGSKVLVQGALRTRKWTDQKGVDHYTTEIHAGNGGVTFLDSRRTAASKQQNDDQQNTEDFGDELDGIEDSQEEQQHEALQDGQRVPF